MATQLVKFQDIQNYIDKLLEDQRWGSVVERHLIGAAKMNLHHSLNPDTIIMLTDTKFSSDLVKSPADALNLLRAIMTSSSHSSPATASTVGSIAASVIGAANHMAGPNATQSFIVTRPYTFSKLQLALSVSGLNNAKILMVCIENPFMTYGFQSTYDILDDVWELCKDSLATVGAITSTISKGLCYERPETVVGSCGVNPEASAETLFTYVLIGGYNYQSRYLQVVPPETVQPADLINVALYIVSNTLIKLDDDSLLNKLVYLATRLDHLPNDLKWPTGHWIVKLQASVEDYLKSVIGVLSSNLNYENVEAQGKVESQSSIIDEIRDAVRQIKQSNYIHVNFAVGDGVVHLTITGYTPTHIPTNWFGIFTHEVKPTLEVSWNEIVKSLTNFTAKAIPNRRYKLTINPA